MTARIEWNRTKIFQLEGTHNNHPVQQLEHVWADQRLRTLSKCLSNHDGPGALTTPSGSLVQSLTTLLVKKCFPTIQSKNHTGQGNTLHFLLLQRRRMGKERINAPRNLSLKNRLGYLSYNCHCAIVHDDICFCEQLLNLGKEILK